MTGARIPIAQPMVGEEEITAVSSVLRSGMLAQGKKVEELEHRFAAYCGTDHAVAVNSGTAALHAALLAMGVGPGDEVIVPSFTFFATASCVSMCGARPVFADVDADTFNIDPSSVLEAITPSTKAVIGVHLFGQPFDVRALSDICVDHRLDLLEDAAQAHGAAYHEKKVGGLGHAACFSFYATKNMITGEGGMVTSDDAQLMDRIRLIINHGQQQKYLHVRLGYNFRLTDICAAIGLVQLKKLDTMNGARIHNADRLTREITATGITTPYCATGNYHVYHQYVVKVGDPFPLTRDALAEHLNRKGIGTAIHYPIPLHRQPLYAGESPEGLCPVSDRLSRSVLSLPVHPLLTEQDLSRISGAIQEVQ
ncbi:MAG: DegT/DnrJ/EryC1/StrS family aminotransferase [Methanomicrobiales archaeon]|nr:DegT/DnrJ/EryC1/StrS family aminotransferase [Methanomicrobiales archaeon]